MNDKRIIENYKTVRTVEQAQPKPLTDLDHEFIKATINDGLSKALANPRPETRSYKQIVAEIENDRSLSPEFLEFKLKIAAIANRLRRSISS